MMIENKNTVFEHWLAAYGTHLEELAGAGMRGSGHDERPSQKMQNPQSEREQ